MTRPVTWARRRAMLVMFGFKLHRSKPWPISAFEYFGYAGDDDLLRQSGGSHELGGAHCGDCGEAIRAEDDAVAKR